MRTLRLATLLTAALAVSPLAAFAAAPATTKTAHQQHSTTGTVKSVDANSLVITRSGKKKDELSFMLSSSTRRDGAIAVGAPVSVRYQDEGKTHMATAVAVRPTSNVTTHK